MRRLHDSAAEVAPARTAPGLLELDADLVMTRASENDSAPTRERTRSASPFLVAEEVAERLRCSLRTIHELVRTRRIPHRRLPGSRRLLFRVDELAVWEDGAALEVIEPPGGGRVVRPKRDWS
jgi:excisionase family DNA binding protein